MEAVQEATKPTKSANTQLYAIQTGLYFEDERTGRRWAVLTCADDQNGESWLEEESSIGDSRRTSHCPGSGLGMEQRHDESHRIVSLVEAVELGLFDADEGIVLVPNVDILAAALSRGEQPKQNGQS